MRYAWIQSHRDSWPVSRMCRALRVSRSGFYSWMDRPPSRRDRRRKRLEEAVSESHSSSYRIYGYRKIHRDLVDKGIEDCCAETVRRAMQRLGIRSRRARKFVVTTDSDHALPVAANLLERDFSASGPNEKWLADITYLDTSEGWLYLAVVLDCYSRLIAGWAMSESIDADLVCSALRMALLRRDLPSSCELIHHSDRGSQYASDKLTELLVASGIKLSMSRKGNPWDNAMMESFYGSLKSEWIDGPFETRSDGELEIFKYIEMFYNPVRLHESLDYISPLDFEKRFEQVSGAGRKLEA